MTKLISEQQLPQDKLYGHFFAENPLVQECLENGKLFQTYWQGAYSKNSCSFIDMKNVSECQVCANLKDVFGITNELFEGKYCMAISGDGQEYRRISTLHSSSLVALLCFYSLSKDHPLMVEIDGQNVEFYKSLFEQKNPIDKEGQHKSNMDVVLIGRNDAGESVILFLESKFSEYLTHGKYDQISFVYDDIYRVLIADGQPIDGLEIKPGKDGWSITAMPNRPQQYCQGVKQMISHYLGIQNGFIEDKGKEYDHIYLGEILFKFPESVDKKHMSYDSYVGLYKQLARKLNTINSEPKFKMLESSFTYQDLLRNFRLDDKVREFYKI
ncbi:MAG: hypothetical protein U0K81_02510 [Paludibacteraceae bacterium]|nr:hypothetical protein [Paludibacteraceae bacterium]